MGSRAAQPQVIALAAVLAIAAGAAQSACDPSVAELRWDGGAARFSVEIADDSVERARGLMYRDAMPKGAGMLFVYDRPQAVSFWMRNTRIPLDMIFIRADGHVAHVHSNARPMDETPIPGGSDDILMVLEINGGLAGRLGIDQGAELRHPALD